jgi:hypothetical protein
MLFVSMYLIGFSCGAVGAAMGGGLGNALAVAGFALMIIGQGLTIRRDDLQTRPGPRGNPSVCDAEIDAGKPVSLFEVRLGGRNRRNHPRDRSSCAPVCRK